ncbi:MAG: ROK family protein [Acidobacteriota bacterium]
MTPTRAHWERPLFGAGRNALPMFYMTISTGIGGGLVLPSGEVYRGADCWAAEIGHMTIRPTARIACVGPTGASNGCVAACGWSAIMAGGRRNFFRIRSSCAVTWSI